MKREFCERVILECEELGQKMGMDFYQTMKKAPAVVERWKPYILTAQQVWQNANNREEAIQYLLVLPDPSAEEFEKVTAFIRTLPYLLRGLLQDAAKGLPSPPGGRPHGLTLDQSREVCKQIGQLYGAGVALADAKLRMAQRYGVSHSTIQRSLEETHQYKFSSKQLNRGYCPGSHAGLVIKSLVPLILQAGLSRRRNLPKIARMQDRKEWAY